jgi:hypothetical protein
MKPLLAARMVCFLFLASYTSSSFSTGGAISLIGTPVSAGSTDTGLREIVKLTDQGYGLFVAQPRNPLIPLITIFAPGASDSWLILREHAGSKGQRHLLLTSPESFNQRVSRATLYLSPHSINPILEESLEGQWRLRQGELVHLGETDNPRHAAPSKLIAFPTSGLGLYRIVPEREKSGAASEVNPQEETTASQLAGGSVLQGIRSWLAALFLLVVVTVISGIIHKRDAARAH